MSMSAHIHIIDGKQVAYPESTCPICHPELAKQKTEPSVPTVYRKGNTIVIKISRATMGTTTYWQKGNAFLMSLKRMMFNTDKKAVRGPQGRPLWNNITIRLSVDLAKQYVAELSKLIHDVEGGTVVPKRE